MARILLVEDDVHMLRVLAMWLAKNGHRIIEARDGRAAADLLSSESSGEPIDLIVSDINMPRMSGLDLAHWVRHERSTSIPIILLSSRCDQSQIASQMLPYGITIHPKPFSPSRLVTQIEAALEKSSGVAGGLKGG